MPHIRNKSHNEMMNILSQFTMNQLGFGPVGEIRMLTNGSSNSHNYYRDRVNEANLFTSVSLAEAAMTTQRNDVLLVTPDSHAWKGDTNAGGEALTWDKTNTHMLGLSPASLAGYNRARFSHSGYTMANFMTVSGDDNCFKHLRFMHGSSTGGASDVTCVTVSGVGNRFEYVAFAGPNNAAQAGATGYIGVSVSGSHNYFKSCMFGSVNDVSRTAANTVLGFTTGCGGWNIFEDCVFRSRCDAATPYFINDAVTDTVVDYTAIFLNCKFLNQGTALTIAIKKAATSQRKLFFDNRCTFANVTNIATSGQEASILAGGGNPDGAADYDSKKLLHARAVATT